MSFDNKSIVAGGFALAVAVGAAAYQLGKDTASDKVGALETAIDAYRNPNQSSNGNQNAANTANELTAKISQLENERAKLSDELAKISIDALSPQSELGGLIKQLESSDIDLRQAALTGLFTINDSRSALPISTFYRAHPNELPPGLTLTELLKTVWRYDSRVGFDLSIFILESAEADYQRNWAFDFLRDRAWSKAKEFDQMIPALRSIALKSNDNLVRTRAKVLLQQREAALKDHAQEAEKEAAYKAELEKVRKESTKQ